MSKKSNRFLEGRELITLSGGKIRCGIFFASDNIPRGFIAEMERGIYWPRKYPPSVIEILEGTGFVFYNGLRIPYEANSVFVCQKDPRGLFVISTTVLLRYFSSPDWLTIS